MIVWVLHLWLCSSPGPTGECRPMPDQVFATRGECLRARNAERRESVHVWSGCRMRREPAEWNGPEAPV